MLFCAGEKTQCWGVIAMADNAAESPPAAPSWGAELSAGISVGLLAIPLSLAPAVLVFSPLGPAYAAAGATAGLIGAVIGGIIAALFATSSFVVTVPRASNALILSTVIATLMTRPAFAGNDQLIIAMAALCVLLAGLWQVLFGIFRVARVIKFTPHPVFAGFCNGVALLLIDSQILPFFRDASGKLTLIPSAEQLTMLVFALVLAVFAVNYARLAAWLSLPRWLARVPGTVAIFAVGTAIYFAVGAVWPEIGLGPRLGALHLSLDLPLTHIADPGNLERVIAAGWNLLLVSFVLALVASMETLMSFRAAQQLADVEFHPVRDLAAQGISNTATALLAPVANSASPALLTLAYRCGGRTRATGLVAAAAVLLIGVVGSDILAQVPTIVLSATLIATGIVMIDAWSVRLGIAYFTGKSGQTRRRDAMDLIVVVAVMAITALTTVVIGVVVGGVLSALIFVINMSRPVVRERLYGDKIFSRRMRSADDIAILTRSGRRRAVLQLEGVLFFGNAEDLSRHVKELEPGLDTIVLDMRAVTDIDVSGVTILLALTQRSRERSKHLLFCNVPEHLLATIRGLFDSADAADAAVKPDLESALEWVEEETLRESLHERGSLSLLPLEEIDFVEGLTESELAELQGVLKLRHFKSGEAVCSEGDAGDRMWFLAQGSVSVRLQVGDGRGSRRIASLGRGTMFGEMALLEGTVRSASIVADEPVVCYELTSEDFDALLRGKPVVATKIMRNLARELTRRLRRTSHDLRYAAS